VAGAFVSSIENIVEIFSSIFIAAYMGFVSDPQIQAGLRGALVVSKQNYLHISMKQRPALECIPLDDPTVAIKRLRR
jgi:hypothetical protein